MGKHKDKKRILSRIRDELGLAAHGYQEIYPSEEDKQKGAWVWSSSTGVQVGSKYTVQELLEAPELVATERKSGGYDITPKLGDIFAGESDGSL